jgi:hypothetical protein
VNLKVYEIEGARFSEEPYPYFVKDDLLNPQLVSDMKRNWPGPGYFSQEIPGNYVCGVDTLQSDGFWRNFIHDIFPSLAFNTLRFFAPWLEARYPGIGRFHVANYSLMQAEGDYGGHNVHNHHYHDPTWAATLLLYLDNTEGHHGTTVMRGRSGEDEALAAAQTLEWRDLTEEVETVGFRQNRLFAFHDNPIAYHCVKPSQGRFGRRIFRAHLSADGMHCDRLYGVDYPTYQKKRMEPTRDDEVVGWMRRDIELLRNPVRMTVEEKAAWIATKELGLMPPRARPSGPPK